MRSCLVIFAYVLFGLIIGPVLISFNLWHHLSSPAQIKQDLSDTNTYSRITSLSSEDIQSLLSSENRDSETEISGEQIALILNSVPADTLQRLVEQVIDNISLSLKEGKNSADIDISEVKAIVINTQAQEAQEILAEALPNNYSIQLPQSNQGIFKILRSSLAKYLGIIILILLILIVFLSAKGFRSKFHALSIISFIGAILLGFIAVIARIIPVHLTTIGSVRVSSNLLSIGTDLLLQIKNSFLYLTQLEALALLAAALVFFGVSFAFKNNVSDATVKADDGNATKEKNNVSAN